MASRIGWEGAFLTLINAALLLTIGFGAHRHLGRLDQAHRDNHAAGPPREFAVALQHARNPRPEDVSQTLIALTPTTPGLFWYPHPDAAEARVLVATWAVKSKYEPSLRRRCRLSSDVWVSPVPQLESACRAFDLSGAALGARLAQYLGLRPGDDQQGRSVVELWAKRKDVFRPCPDRETEDRRCDLGPPKVAAGPQAEDAIKHAIWFLGHEFESYSGDKPYPWTRLGYTYDWGSPASHVGATEYVIPEGSLVWVQSVTSTDEYCAPREVDRQFPEGREESDASCSESVASAAPQPPNP
jgi:hypothetical protein